MLLTAVLALLLWSFAEIASAEEIELYVSPDGNDSWAGTSLERPFLTLQKARDNIRALKRSGGLTEPVTVNVRGGLYELTEPLVFTTEDSGTKECPVTYTAYEEESPVIRGSRKITGPWKDYKGKIKVCDIPDVRAGKWAFRQLFLNGTRQQRARMPDEGFYRIDNPLEERDSFQYEAGHFKQWINLNDVEVVIIHSYNESRLLVSELDETERIVTFTGPIGRRLEGGERRTRYYSINPIYRNPDPLWYKSVNSMWCQETSRRPLHSRFRLLAH